MVRAEITPVTDNCYDHPDDDSVRRCLHIFFTYSLLDGHLVSSLSLSYPYVFTAAHAILYTHSPRDNYFLNKLSSPYSEEKKTRFFVLL